MDWFFTLLSISTGELILRVALAMAFGLVLGLERDWKNKPIDFRAYMIVAVATCIIAVMGQELYEKHTHAEDFISLDLGKIISGTLTGIGFLGAGAIIKRDDQNVVGTATGASIWASGGIGLSLGFGFYELAVIAFVATAIILIGGGLMMPVCKDQKDKEKS